MEIAVPNSLNSITLKSYQKLISMEEPSEADTLSILLSVDIRIIRNLKAVSVVELNNHLKSLFSEDQKLQRHFKIDGVEFGFIPNLDDATYGEITDIETNIGKFETMHKAMAVLFRPVKHKKGDMYIIEDYVPGKYDDTMLKAPLGAVLGAHVFFYNLMKDLSTSTLSYMKEEVRQAKSKGILPESGEDMDSYLLSLEEMLCEWKEHLN